MSASLVLPRKGGEIATNRFEGQKLAGVDFGRCQIRINKGKGDKDRVVPFSASFKETLPMHADSMNKKQAVFLFVVLMGFAPVWLRQIALARVTTLATSIAGAIA